MRKIRYNEIMGNHRKAVKMGYNGYTEKRKASNEKYLAKFAEIRIRITPEEKKIIEDNARNVGKSVNQYLKDLGLGNA